MPRKPGHFKAIVPLHVTTSKKCPYSISGAAQHEVAMLHEIGESLPAGSFVMSGGITEAIAVQPGDFVCARFQELGSVSMRFA